MTSLSRRALGSIAATAFLALFALVRLVPVVGAADRSALSGRLDSGTTLIAIERLSLATVSLVTLAVGILVLGVVTVRRRGVGAGVRIVASVVGAAVSAELLKRVLPFDPGQTDAGQAITSGSFPSGHSAIAAAFALAVMATLSSQHARRWWGPLVVWVSLVAVGTVAAGWHRPSDAVAGVLLAVVWHTALVRRPAADALQAKAAREPLTDWSLASVPGWRWWLVACAAILVAALLPHAGTEIELRETASHLYVVGLAAVLATTGALMLVVQDRVPVRSS